MAVFNNGTSYYETAVALTKTAPTLSTEGQALTDLDSITVLVRTTSTAVRLAGAGTLQCYVYDATVADWVRLPAADFTVTLTTQHQAFEAIEVVSPRASRIIWCPTSVTTDTTNLLNYDTQTGNFTAGQVITGGTSGATATIVRDVDSGTAGVLALGAITGTFQDNELITDPITGSALVNGLKVTPMTLTVYQLGYSKKVKY